MASTNGKVIDTIIKGEVVENVTGALDVTSPSTDPSCNTVVSRQVEEDAKLTINRTGGAKYVGGQPPIEVAMKFAEQASGRQADNTREKARAAENVSFRVKVTANGNFTHHCTKPYDAKLHVVTDEIKHKLRERNGKDYELVLTKDGQPLKGTDTIKEAGIKQNDVLVATENARVESSLSGASVGAQHA